MQKTQIAPLPADKFLLYDCQTSSNSMKNILDCTTLHSVHQVKDSNSPHQSPLPMSLYLSLPNSPIISSTEHTTYLCSSLNCPAKYDVFGFTKSDLSMRSPWCYDLMRSTNLFVYINS